MNKWRCRRKYCLKWIRLFERLSQELFMSEFQYQNSTKWWCHQWIGLILLKLRSYHIIPKFLKPSFIIFGSRNQIPVPKWKKKTKSGKKCYGLQVGAIRGWQIGEGFKDCKSGQEGLQIGEALGISNRGKDFKSSQWDYKSWQKLQIGVEQLSTIKFLY